MTWTASINGASNVQRLWPRPIENCPTAFLTGIFRTTLYGTIGFRRETPGASGPIALSLGAIHSFRFTMDGHRPTEITTAITSIITIFHVVVGTETALLFQIIHRLAVPLVVR